MGRRTQRSQESPDLSVIITTYDASATISRCLESLQRQHSNHHFEIILVDSSNDSTASLVAAQFPAVRQFHFSERHFPGEARNFGIHNARADIIAFLDADCYVNPNWVEAVLKAHDSPYWVVGGIIDNGSRDSLLAWAYYFCEFNLWLPSERKRDIAEIAACCLSMKRVAFERYGPFLERTYCSDTAFQWKMARDGRKVLFDPSIRVYHTVRCTLYDFVAHIVWHRRFFARVSCREQQLTRFDRFVRIGVTIVSPALLMMLVSWRVIRSETDFGRYCLAFPLVVLGFLARAWGELRGYAG